MINIAFCEFKRFFRTLLPWVLLAAVQFILAYLFLAQTEDYIRSIQAQIIASQATYGVTDIVLSRLYLYAGILMLTIMPLLTMRSFAEERQNNSLVLLKAAPLSSTQIVLGKYLAQVLFILCFISLISLMPLSLLLGTSLDLGQLFSSTLGLCLLLSSFAAAGLFFSIISKQAIMAALLSFACLCLFALLYFAGSRAQPPSELLLYLSHFSHYLSFLSGFLDSRDIIYYLLFIVAFLVLTIRKLDNERLK